METRRIVCFGGAGSIGSELVKQLSKNNDVYILDIDETRFFDLFEELRLEGHKISGRVGDVRNKDTVEEVFSQFQPDCVFIASACKHVTPSEWNPEEPISTNIIGTLNIVRAAQRHGVRDLIFISTDKVINFSSVMGVTKRLGELIVKNAGYISVRFGNVMGSRGSVIPIWQKQIDENKSLTVTDERMTRYMMTIPDACALIIKAQEVGKSGDILIMDMGEKVNVLKLAQEILQKSGKDIEVKMIGIRPGETLSEELMTEYEKQNAVKQDNFWIIK